MKQSGSAETVLSSQAIPLAPVIPIVADSFSVVHGTCPAKILMSRTCPVQCPVQEIVQNYE